MAFWDFLSNNKTNHSENPLPGIDDFLREHLEMGERLFLTTRSNGQRVALALAPLTARRNKYNVEVEDAPATILVEGQKSLNTAEWYQGSSPELSCDQGKPVGRDPFAPGMNVDGGLQFSFVEKAPPFHEAHGLDWWAEEDGQTLRTLLNYHTLPESRLLWRQYDPKAESLPPITPLMEISAFVGAWTRYHYVEGKVVIDSSEGSGFSTEGGESWSEKIIVWEDGAVSVMDDAPAYRGQLRNSTIQWDRPVAGPAPEGTRASSRHFQPYDGPVELNGDELTIGGYTFTRVQDTEPA